MTVGRAENTGKKWIPLYNSYICIGVLFSGWKSCSYSMLDVLSMTRNEDLSKFSYSLRSCLSSFDSSLLLAGTLVSVTSALVIFKVG